MATDWKNKESGQSRPAYSTDPWILDLQDQIKRLDTGGTYLPSDIQIEVKSGTQSTIGISGGDLSSTAAITDGSGYTTSGTSDYTITVTPYASRTQIQAGPNNVFDAGWISSAVGQATKASAADEAGTALTIKIKPGSSGAADRAAVTNTNTISNETFVSSTTTSYAVTVTPYISGGAVTIDDFTAGYVASAASGVAALSDQLGTAATVYIKAASLNSNNFIDGGQGGYSLINQQGILEPINLGGIKLGSTNFVLQHASETVVARMDENEKFILSSTTGADMIITGGTGTNITVEGAQVVTDGDLNIQSISTNQEQSGTADYTVTGPIGDFVFSPGWQSAAKRIRVDLAASTLSAKSSSLSGVEVHTFDNVDKVTLNVTAIIQKNQAGYVNADDATFTYQDVNTGILVYQGAFVNA